MIRSAKLGDYEFTTSALGFGTAGIFHEPSRSARSRLLETAIESGILHFDVAPMYGLGLAEGELGRSLRGHRDSVVIATKVGIGLTPYATVLGRVQGPARSVLKKMPRMQSKARESAEGPTSGGLGGLLYKSTFEPRSAQRSLDLSLRDLGTHIDLLLLHEPVPSQIDSEGLYEVLERARSSGKIRSWGIAGEADQVADVSALLHDQTPVAQVRDDIIRRQPEPWSAQYEYLITFGLLGFALPRILQHVNSSAERMREWSDAVGEDCAKAPVVANLLLRDSLRANARGTVLYSTTRPERLRAAAAVFMSDPSQLDPSLDAFRRLVAGQLGTNGTDVKGTP